MTIDRVPDPKTLQELLTAIAELCDEGNGFGEEHSFDNRTECFALGFDYAHDALALIAKAGIDVRPIGDGAVVFAAIPAEGGA